MHGETPKLTQNEIWKQKAFEIHWSEPYRCSIMRTK